MLFECKNVKISLTHLSCITKEAVCLDLYLENDCIDYMEIGDKHLLCNEHMRGVVGSGKKNVHASLSIYAQNVSEQTTVDNPEKTYLPIGEASFFPADENFKYGTLAYKVYIPAISFETLKQTVICGKRITCIYLEIENMDLGWEPDGSHKIWPINKDLSTSSYMTANILKISYEIT